MPRLEAICEQLTPQNHNDFRLWLTSSPSPKFPVSVLQNSVKMTLEPPSGLKQNLLQTYSMFDNKMLNDCAMPVAYKKLLFAFSFFHALVQDRRKFGPIGWNIPYAFMQEEFDVCQRQLKIFLDEAKDNIIPYKVLIFLGAEVNYGGRVTDDKDVRLIGNILRRFVNPRILEDDYALSASGLYKSIPAGSVEDYIEYIKSLPLNPSAEAFGMHENAEITTNQENTRLILGNVLSIQPRQTGGGGKTREQAIGEIAIQIQEKTPPAFDIEEVQLKYPTDYNESMNTVLTQELVRYNKLLVIMAEMLAEL
jgi:dynein heavy chain